jgi:hypothetical protein
MRASEVSPGGRVRLLPDGVDEVVGMVAGEHYVITTWSRCILPAMV